MWDKKIKENWDKDKKHGLTKPTGFFLHAYVGQSVQDWWNYLGGLGFFLDLYNFLLERLHFDFYALHVFSFCFYFFENKICILIAWCVRGKNHFSIFN